MTIFKTHNSNNTLWTADVIMANFVKKKKTEQDKFFYYKYGQNKLFLTSVWPGQTLHHKIQYGYDLSFNTQY